MEVHQCISHTYICIIPNQHYFDIPKSQSRHAPKQDKWLQVHSCVRHCTQNTSHIKGTSEAIRRVQDTIHETPAWSVVTINKLLTTSVATQLHSHSDLGSSTEWLMERGVGSIWCLCCSLISTATAPSQVLTVSSDTLRWSWQEWWREE